MGHPARPTAAERHGDQAWLTRLNQELPLLGHRNWIAVVDSAYPLQTSPGIETLETDADQLSVVRVVMNRISRSQHVRPVVLTDAELKAVPESDAPGVTYYRDSLSHLLEQFSSAEVQSLPHEEIISRLDEAGQKFHVLVLKTRMTIPYTSVFIRLDCGYWTDEQEKRLRERMGRSFTTPFTADGYIGRLRGVVWPLSCRGQLFCWSEVRSFGSDFPNG